jgi:hypothetical protein
VAAWNHFGADQLFWINEQNSQIDLIYPDNARA